MKNQVTIIGGGISGLSVAWSLQQRGVPWRLLEASGRLGGKVQSEFADGFLMELGPDSFLTDKPHGMDQCRALGLGNQFVPCNNANRSVSILFRDRLIPYPKGMRLFIPVDADAFAANTLLSPEGTQRALAECDLPGTPVPPGRDESLASFVTRRFGAELLERVAAPILAGIYAADPESLSMATTFPRFLEMERQHGSLMRAMQQAAPVDPDHAPFTNLKRGMQQWADALAAALTGDIQLNTAPDSLPEGIVVLATPAPAAADLVEGRSPALAKRLRQIKHLSAGVVSLAYRAYANPPRGFGFMSVLSEPSPLVGCTFVSNKFDGKAPPGDFLLRAFLGGQKGEAILDRSDEEIVDVVRDELNRLAGVDRKPVLSRVCRMPAGNPQYETGHLDRMTEIERMAAEEIPGLHFCGHAWRGIGLSDCVREAEELAESLVRRFR